jgi:uncharacterized coiled-coil protein SlyX
MSTPTPRTHAAVVICNYGKERVTADFARTLERELHESRNAEMLARVQLGNERERSSLLLAAMNERDDGYFESRKRMIALESELTAKGQAVRNLAEVISGQDKELVREREKVRALRLACERIVAEWDSAYDANPIGAGGWMYSLASKALGSTEDTKT